MNCELRVSPEGPELLFEDCTVPLVKHTEMTIEQLQHIATGSSDRFARGKATLEIKRLHDYVELLKSGKPWELRGSLSIREQ